MQTYQGGTIYWSGTPGDAAHVVYGTIAARYDSLGGAGGTHILVPSAPGQFQGQLVYATLEPGYGLPTSDEADVSDVPGLHVSIFRPATFTCRGRTRRRHLVGGTFQPDWRRVRAHLPGDGLQRQPHPPGSGGTHDRRPGRAGRVGAHEMQFAGGTIYWSGGNDLAVHHRRYRRQVQRPERGGAERFSGSTHQR